MRLSAELSIRIKQLLGHTPGSSRGLAKAASFFAFWELRLPVRALRKSSEKDSFRFELPLDKFQVGQYAVQAITVNSSGEQAAFARNYFALRLPVQEGAETSGESNRQ